MYIRISVYNDTCHQKSACAIPLRNERKLNATLHVPTVKLTNHHHHLKLKQKQKNLQKRKGKKTKFVFSNCLKMKTVCMHMNVEDDYAFKR